MRQYLGKLPPPLSTDVICEWPLIFIFPHVILRLLNEYIYRIVTSILYIYYLVCTSKTWEEINKTVKQSWAIDSLDKGVEKEKLAKK